MFTSPTWLPTGLKNHVQGLIDCVTLPDEGNRRNTTGMNSPPLAHAAPAADGV